ncbi:MAG: hypothetical protein ABFD76_05755 [Smithella sp.]
MKAPYIIMAPPYRHTSAGVRALYRLKDELIKRGYQATICQGGKAPFGSIVVYPEIVEGNPLQGKTVARWVLNYPGLLGGEKEYDKNEIVFTWSELYYDAPLLMLPLIEDFFRDDNLPRSGGCFWVGKSDAERIPETDGMTEITYEWPTTREELARLFNEKEVFYTYDNNTMMTREAEMCGCKVVVIGERLESDYDEFVKDYENQIENFIEVTQNAVDKVKVSFGVMINDFQRYDMVLKQSELDPNIHCHYVKSPESATKGLNVLLGIMEAEGADIAVLTHQDMFYRQGWVELMKEKISELPESWVVAGVVGKDMEGNICGKFHDMRIPLHFNTSHRHKFPVPAACFDECCIIVNLKKGFRFDERLDGFDIYGTMCVLQAWERGETAWIIEAFCEHYCMRPFTWFPDEVFARRWKWLYDTYKDAPKIDSTVFGVPKDEPEILKPENMFPKSEAA